MKLITVRLGSIVQVSLHHN